MTAQLRIFASDVEAELSGRLDRSQLVRAVDRDLGMLAGLVGSAEDVVAVDCAADGRGATAGRGATGAAAGLAARWSLRARLLELGIACARPIAVDREAGVLHWTTDVAEAAVEGVAPWAWTPRTHRLLSPLLAAREDASRDEIDATIARRIEAGRRLGDKGAIGALRAAIGAPGGMVVASLEALLAAWSDADARGEAWIVKARWGGSGRDATRLWPGRGEPSASQLGWMKQTLQRQGGLVVERFYQRGRDLGLLLVPDADGRVQVAPPHQTLCELRGGFRGLVVRPRGAPALLDRAAAMRALDVAKALRAACAEAGHQGAAGVDLIERLDADADPRPWPVEINARWTIGHVGFGLGRALAEDAEGLLLIAGPADARDAGRDLDALVVALDAALPLDVGVAGLRRGAIALGVGGGAIAPMLLVARDAVTIAAACADVGLRIEVPGWPAGGAGDAPS